MCGFYVILLFFKRYFCFSINLYFLKQNKNLFLALAHRHKYTQNRKQTKKKQNCNIRCIVGNVGLSASAESVHQAKRPSRRGQASRHHPHRSSSRRNKENGGSRSGSFRNKCAAGQQNSQDEHNRIRKARTVSFEQPPVVVVVPSTATLPQWCDYTKSIEDHLDRFINHHTTRHQQQQHNATHNALIQNSDITDNDELMDTSPPIEFQYKAPPRV